jgi:hypothetical protein
MVKSTEFQLEDTSVFLLTLQQISTRFWTISLKGSTPNKIVIRSQDIIRENIYGEEIVEGNIDIPVLPMQKGNEYVIFTSQFQYMNHKIYESTSYQTAPDGNKSQQSDMNYYLSISHIPLPQALDSKVGLGWKNGEDISDNFKEEIKIRLKASISNVRKQCNEYKDLFEQITRKTQQSNSNR